VLLLDYLAYWLCVYLQCLTPLTYLPVLEHACLAFTLGLTFLWRLKGLMLGICITVILALLGLLLCILNIWGVLPPA